MNERDVRKFLDGVKRGQVTVDSAVERLRHLPFEDLGFAKIDHHRTLRQGYPEAVFALGKTPKQVTEIVRGMLRAGASNNILITRADRRVFAAVRRLVRFAPRRNAGRAKPNALNNVEFHELSGTISIERSRAIYGKGLILVVTAVQATSRSARKRSSPRGRWAIASKPSTTSESRDCIDCSNTGRSWLKRASSFV
jgi:NCAIR mutase (PurE)-related protein